MSSAVPITKARILMCKIKGAELYPYCRKIVIRESICTSYISGEVVIYDNNNVINELQLVGGEEVLLSFDAPINSRKYNVALRVLAIQGEPSPDNLKTIIYTISLVGDEYFTDRENLVQESPPIGTPGASVAQKVWKDCGFTSKLFALIDAPIRDATEAFTIQNVKPFTAIAQIRNQMHYPQYPTGNVLLYRDYYQQNLVPLQYLFDKLSPQAEFIQKATWGADWRDIFESEKAIIDAKQMTRNQTSGGRGGVQLQAATSNQGKRAFDNIAGKLATNLIFSKPMSGAGGFAGMVQGAFKSTNLLGGMPNVIKNNLERASQAIDFTNKVETERSFAANCKAGPQYNIRVPLQLGINCTVGKGATFNLLPPVGDQAISGYDPNGGLMLITDLIHEVWSDLRQVLGTTTFQTMKGYFRF